LTFARRKLHTPIARSAIRTLNIRLVHAGDHAPERRTEILEKG
jgi:hypothetical protein